MKKLILLLLFIGMLIGCTTNEVEEPEQELNYCEIVEGNCYGVKLGYNYEATGEEPEVILPEGTNPEAGVFVFCSLPHGTKFFSGGYYYIVDCRYD